MATPSSASSIGVLLPVDATFTRLAARGLKRAAQQHGLRLVLYTCLSSEIFDRIGDDISLASIGYDCTHLAGTISFFGGPSLINQLAAQHQNGHPTAFVLRAGGGVPHIMPDDEPAFEALVCRLHRHGHRRIAHLHGAANNLSAARRLRGYRRGLDKVGLPFDPQLVLPTHFSAEQSFQAVTHAFERDLGITAIIAANDNVAFGALRAAKARGIAIPEQLEVVGYDNHFSTALSEPPLSTFQIPLEEMAREAVAQVVAQIRGHSPRAESLLVPGFVPRSSTRFTDTDLLLDTQPDAFSPEGPLPAPLIRLIEELPGDGPIETILTSADPIIREGIRLDADLPSLIHAIIEHACRSPAPNDLLSADRRREILSAALRVTLNTTRLTHAQASAQAQTFNGITQRLREGMLDHAVIATVVREALGASGFQDARLYLKALGDAPRPSGTLHQWDLVSNQSGTTPAEASIVLQSALELIERHPLALILPLIINNEVHGHIITDGHNRFRPDLARLVRDVSTALHSVALHQELTRSNATLKESEYFYASLVESLPQIIVRKNAAGHITYANSGFAAIVGRPLDQILGRTDFEIVPSEFARKLRTDDLRVLTTGQPLDDERTYMIDGQTKMFHVHKSPLCAPDGAVTGVQVIFWDVTSFRETETRLRETQRELIEVSRRAGIAEIATGILHNIGNGLNSVNTSAGVVSEKLHRMKIASVGRIEELLTGANEAWRHHFIEDERGRKIVDYARALSHQLEQSRADAVAELKSLRDGVEHVNQIVAAQQQFAQISGVVEDFEPSEAADYALRLCETELLRHGIAVTRDYQPAPRVRLERHKAIQILVNLIRNAKDALAHSDQPAKAVHIRIRTSANGQAQLVVQDNGVGIGTEALARMFTMGFTTKQGGHGFGLHNSALTATALGGSLQVESEGPGRGARFLLHLPPASLES